METGSLISIMAEKYGLNPTMFAKTIKATCMPRVKVGDGQYREASDEEFAALLVVANQYNLNPLTKEIYAFPTKGGGIMPVVSIDGWISMVNAHREFDGVEFNNTLDEKGNITAIECVLYRKDRTRPTKVTEYMSECKRGTDPWTSHPKRMLRHKALIQSARIAFGFSGIMDDDEIEAMGYKVVTGTVVETPMLDAVTGVSVTQPTLKEAVKAGAAKLKTTPAAPQKISGSDGEVATATTAPLPAKSVQEVPPPKAAAPVTKPEVTAQRGKTGQNIVVPPPAEKKPEVKKEEPPAPEPESAETGSEIGEEPAASPEVGEMGDVGSDGSEAITIASLFKVKAGKYKYKLVSDNTDNFYVDDDAMAKVLQAAWQSKPTKRVALWFDVVDQMNVVSQVRVLD